MKDHLGSSMRRIMNLDLQDPFLYKYYKEQGFCWIKRHYPRFDLIMRNPTIGFPVEIYTNFHPGCVKIDSRSGRKLIKKICYC
jgi:hypothetical protein